MHAMRAFALMALLAAALVAGQEAPGVVRGNTEVQSFPLSGGGTVYVTSELPKVDRVQTSEGAVEIVRSDGKMHTQEDEDAAEMAVEAMREASTLFDRVLPSIFGAPQDGPSWLDQQFDMLNQITEQMLAGPGVGMGGPQEDRIKRVMQSRFEPAVNDLVETKARRAPEGYTVASDEGLPVFLQLEFYVQGDAEPFEAVLADLMDMGDVQLQQQRIPQAPRTMPSPMFARPQVAGAREGLPFHKHAHTLAERHFAEHGPLPVVIMSGLVAAALTLAAAACCCCCCVAGRARSMDEEEGIYMDQSEQPLLETYEAVHGDDDYYFDFPEHEPTEAPVLYRDTVNVVNYTTAKP